MTEQQEQMAKRSLRYRHTCFPQELYLSEKQYIVSEWRKQSNGNQQVSHIVFISQWLREETEKSRFTLLTTAWQEQPIEGKIDSDSTVMLQPHIGEGMGKAKIPGREVLEVLK